MRTEDQLAAVVRLAPSTAAPTLVLMHFLGGSAREWDEVDALLGDGVSTVRLDLPGFGDSAGVPGYTVEAMVDAVAAAVRTHVTGRYVLVGHSMSGKVAMVLASRKDPALAGLVLVAPSPPSPEPFGEGKREMMLGLLGERHDDDRARARSYITKNELRDIPREVEERASGEVLKMNRAAWVAWLEGGSKEDWAARVGVLDLPTLVVAGEKDLSLGPPQQAELTLPHLKRATLRTVPNCSHLIPMECAPAMAGLLQEFIEGLKAVANVPLEYLTLIARDRVSPKTREVLETRMAGPAQADGVLTADQMKTLQAMLARVIPQQDSGVDLAGFIVARLATGKGDGWRYDILPPDVQAYREGLDQLIHRGFLTMTADGQDEVLQHLTAEPGSADARWFEEVRGDGVSAYVGHPATMARLGYSGIGVGGATTKDQGFVTIGPNETEEWEPVPAR